MSFIRPEARAVMWRLREILFAAGVGVLGLFWILRFGGILNWLGYIVLIIAGVILVAGIQRARFRGKSEGIGVVSIDEGQVSYFGPLNGGEIAMREMLRLELDPTMKPAHWRLVQIGQQVLEIPVDAVGADALFDAFATLPGIKTESMLSSLKAGTDQPVVIWRKDIVRLH